MYLVIAAAALISFLDAITFVVIFFLVAVIFALGLMPFVNWFEKRGVPRVIGALALILLIAGIIVGLGALAARPLTSQVNNLIEDAPTHSKALTDRFNEVVGRYPEIDKRVHDPQLLEKILPSLGTIASRVGRYSATLLTVVLGALILFTTIMYILVSPRPLFRGLITLVPVDMRDGFETAFARGSQSVVGWMWANMMVGAIEGIAAMIFLSALGIPGALVWGLITFFAELIPQLGSYLMAVPPVIMALAVDPILALWVVLFYIALQQLVNNLIAPVIRANTLKIHPVSEMFTVLALTLAFGVLGAIIATPVIGFVKAFYDEFYAKRQKKDGDVDERVENMLFRPQPQTAKESAPAKG